MNKKPNNETVFAKILFIVSFFALLTLPGILTLLVGPDRTAMQSESATRIEPFTPEGWTEGSFQSSFEAWFSAHYPLRSRVVKTYRQFKYDLENAKPVIGMMDIISGKAFRKDKPKDPPADTTPVVRPVVTNGEGETVLPETERSQIDIYLDPDNIYSDINYDQMSEEIYDVNGFRGNNAVYVGKNGYLYEAAYMNEYLGFGAPYTTATEEGIRQTVEELKYIQDELAKRGTTLLFVISSSKASQYADYIPDWYKEGNVAAKDYVRPIDRMRGFLKDSGLNYLDSSEYFKQIGLLVTFPKNGIHWNALAAFESTAELLRMYESVTGERITRLKATGVNYSKTPFIQGNSEVDVFNILYGAVQSDIKIVDKWYYAPMVEVDAEGAKQLNILVQGGSFASSIIWNLSAYQVGRIDSINYSTFGAAHSPWIEGPDAWEYWLKGRDMIIFEATEQQIRGAHYTEGMDWAAHAANGEAGHNAIYDSLYWYLKENEGRY